MSRDALIVGINRYQYLPDLKAPALDAEAIAQRLEEDGDFDTLYRLPERITEGETKKPLVSDSHSVTREQLEQLLEQLFLPGSSQAPATLRRLHCCGNQILHSVLTKLAKSLSIRLEEDVYEVLINKYSGKGELTAWLRKQARIGAKNEGLLS